MSITRRNLFQAAALAAGATTLTATNADAKRKKKAKLAMNDVVLFQGDSITDAGRAKDNANPNDFGALGRGYATMIASQLLGSHAAEKLQCLNRGISGHKVPDLAARWQADTIDLKPALLSILIGVNDMWHARGGKYDGTVADYETGFKRPERPSPTPPWSSASPSSCAVVPLTTPGFPSSTNAVPSPKR